MFGVSWKLTGAIVGFGILALLVYDVSQGSFDKAKLTAAGWKPKA